MESLALIRYFIETIIALNHPDLGENVFEGIAPPKTLSPYVTVQVMPGMGRDVNTTCGKRQQSRRYVLVKIWDEDKETESKARIARIWQQIDPLFQGLSTRQVAFASAGLPAIVVMGIVREEEYPQTIDEKGISYHCIVSKWRCSVHIDA
jgi:hypothetical protein